MIHNIIPDLVDKAEDITKMFPLKRNPHSGDVEAAKAVLLEFGQHAPILIHSTTRQILAGNTRWRAAKELGWTHIAVTVVDEDEARAYARAVSDNRLAELGKDDQSILAEMLPEMVYDYGEVFDALGWDDWEVASLEENVAVVHQETGYTPPPTVRRDSVVVERQAQEDGTERFVAPAGSDERELIQRGAGETDPKRATVIQYTLVFDSAEQQRRWYSFLTWLRSDVELTQYGTTAEKLINFLEPRADF